MTKYSDEATAVKQALDAVYENKRTNKKDDISGDYSSDTESYPTVKAVKATFGSKVTSFGSTTSDSNYPSEKLVKDSLNAKLDTAQGSGNASKNVVTDSNGDIAFEAKPTIPVGEDTDSNILMDGTADAGVSSKFARADHVHPTDTSRAAATHSHSATEVTDANSANYSNIGSLSANSTQQTINNAINTILGTISGLDVINIVGDISNRPTASADTMGKLYICSENSKVNVYYSVEDNSSYSWHKLDTDILDEYTVAWNDVTGKPESFTPSSHTHGNLENDGQVKISGTAQASKNLVTDANGYLTVEAKPTIPTTSDIDTEIEAYLDAIIAAYTPSP